MYGLVLFVPDAGGVGYIQNPLVDHIDDLRASFFQVRADFLIEKSGEQSTEGYGKQDLGIGCPDHSSPLYQEGEQSDDRPDRTSQDEGPEGPGYHRYREKSLTCLHTAHHTSFFPE